jgi:hypothetical protein
MWQSLKKATPTGVEWTRLEARVGTGMPDINGATKFGEFWIELKVCKTKKFKTEGLWRPSQISWQYKRSEHYCNVWNVISHPAQELIHVYNCRDILALNTSEQPPEADLVLSYPVPWQDMLDHINEKLDRNRSVMDYECA